MKRLTILGIIACVGLVFAPAAVIGGPAGPPGGLDVNVVNPVPLPVTGAVDANVTGDVDVNVVNEPGVTVLNDTSKPIPVAVISGGPPLLRYVGLTEPHSAEGPGYIGMNRACQDAFGTGSRMCSTEDFFDSALTQPIGDYAWISVTPASFHTEMLPGGLKLWQLYTRSGLNIIVTRDPDYESFSFNCRDWRIATPADLGAMISPDGELASQECTAILPIACCAPEVPSP